MSPDYQLPTTNYNTFHFESYLWDVTTKTLTCNYALDQTEKFTETVYFDFDISKDHDEAAIDRACFGYFVMAGISYYKAGLPQTIEFAPDLPPLTKSQAAFFQKTYYHGLGELFYQNKITAFTPEFQHSTNYQLPTTNYQPLKNTTIVPLGGGKDSLTSVALLQQAGINFQTWTVGDYPGLAPSLKEIHGPNWVDSHLKIKRTISPNLISLNDKGAINGHIPISALWAFLSVMTAILTNQKYIAFSNEASANQPTLELNGEPINHQYSKTLEFEQDFRAYVQKFIHPELEYFSLLRPLTELQIAEMFSQKAWPKFHDKFSSCNRNFTQSAEGQLFWCGKCPKCAFVFLILAPFVPPGELLKVFKKNLLSDPELKQTWLELLGKTNNKPFECVGTIEEVKQAFILAKKYYPEVAEFESYLDLPTDFDYKTQHEHLIPSDFLSIFNV